MSSLASIDSAFEGPRYFSIAIRFNAHRCSKHSSLRVLMHVNDFHQSPLRSDRNGDSTSFFSKDEGQIVPLKVAGQFVGWRRLHNAKRNAAISQTNVDLRIGAAASKWIEILRVDVLTRWTVHL